MNEGAREANTDSYRMSIKNKLDKIIDLLALILVLIKKDKKE